MTDMVALLVFAMALAGYLFWGIRTLTGERWQILASVPVRKEADGEWSGVNLTWYGLLTANAYVVAVAVLIVLLGAVRVPLAGTSALAAAMLFFCVPASRLVARLVEKKAHTFTVGGAVFVGTVLAPWIVLGINRLLGAKLGFHIPYTAALAAFAVAYAFGEGLGRLACLSFGCCYGRPLRETPPWLKRLLAGFAVTFYGKTRKIAYAGGLEGEKVLPVQTLTAIIYTTCGICAAFLFLKGYFAGAFLVSMLLTQGWRVFSETLRADYRGGGKISAYQVMGIAGIGYGGLSFLFDPGAQSQIPDLTCVPAYLFHPGAIILLQVLWVAIFLYTGRSTVTGATLSFHVREDRI
ncbi:MAG TPA: prolipoprotein diacylglyceryl transferase family protein [Geobacteraceae bacterium]|nr:prolipoprotein diacylglyceryl transferase family protein [Geobacteraceae bacterium]